MLSYAPIFAFDGGVRNVARTLLERRGVADRGLDDGNPMSAGLR